ncbi:MAG: hypothetical protein JO020_03195 [Chloroflexi bacterium]|nr:hypothetical protein [Chloroflexota bacterium]MBV9893155.1 hypothetical protein [Chloroflexota bacterium]
MSAILERTVARRGEVSPRSYSSDWEMPSGPVQHSTQPRVAAPTFVYRGYAEAHLRGQSCHVVGAAKADERMVVMACGCQVSVPWWTLEPIN